MKRYAPLSLALLCIAAVTGCAKEKAKFNPWNLEDLSASEGFEYRLGPFDVPAGEQVQDCYFVTVPDIGGDPIWIKRFRIALNPGSHHFNVFRVNTIINLDGAAGTMVHNGECLNSSNWADWPLVVNSQHSLADNPFYDWTLPDGVDQKFTPGEKLMLQTHYVNATTQQTPYQGRVGINFYRSTDVNPIAMNTLFATQQSIRICQSNPQPEYFGTCAFPAGSNV